MRSSLTFTRQKCNCSNTDSFEQIKVHPFTLSPRPATSQDQTAEMKAAFDWNLQMMGLLRKPHNVLLATVEAWRAFNSEDGDVGYFFDDSDADAEAQEIETRASRHRSMQNIKASLGELSEFQGNMVALSERCSDYKKAVSHLTTGARVFKVKNFC
jgi:hypothetical protein